MRTSTLDRLEFEYEECRVRLKKPSDLIRRVISDHDYLDSAVVGGVSIADVVAGRVEELAIPHDVNEAFALQYPNLHESFAHAVQRLADQDDQLRGLVMGVRGKLFELNYVDYLNHGHLPEGAVAHLARSATNAIWDVAITDHAGRIDRVLQLKASATMAAAELALANHPDVDVVIPHDVFGQVSEHLGNAGHVLDGHVNLTALSDKMHFGVQHAEAADVHFHFPLIGIGIVVFTTYSQYRTGKMTPAEALRSGLERSFLTIAATGAGYAAQALLHKSIIGIPAAFATRYYLGRWLKKRKLREMIDISVTLLQSANERLLIVTSRTIVIGLPETIEA